MGTRPRGGWLAALLDGRPIDLRRPIESSGHLAPLSFADRAGREILQHSAAHLVAKALVEAVPEALPTVGPPTDEGFFYDFDVRPLTPEDLDRVRANMRKSVAAREAFVRHEVTRAEAERRFATNPYKLRYLRDIPPGEPVSYYATGDWADLCRGPHVP
ncbi:threonyl-tRNA synthetase, partial [mine drainage metagenome]